MKIYKITNLFAALLLLLGTSSCLDFEPQQQLADGNYWSQPSDFKLFANNFYGYIRTFTAATEYKSEKPAHSDYYSDLITNVNQRNYYSNGSNAVPEKDGNYGSNYGHIRRCNLLLEKAESYGGNRADIQVYEGEAYFFRAYSYFDLLQLYGDCIIVTRPLEVGAPEMSLPRNDRSEVVDFIIKDLRDAIAMLPAQSKITEAGRISSEAAEAFLSRVALYEGTWQKFRGNEVRGHELLDIAAKAAKNVIDCGAYRLFYDQRLGVTSQKYLFTLVDEMCNPAGLTKSANHEYIITRRYDPVLYPIGSVTASFLNNAIWVSSKLADMYLCQNGLPIEYGGVKNPQFKGYDKIDSEWENRDNRMRYNLMKPHDNFWSCVNGRTTWDANDKNPQYADFKPNKGTGYNNQKFCQEVACDAKKEAFDYPVLRYAEVLLNYAEAVYERDGAISDADLDLSLNLVRLRVNPEMKRLSNALISSNPGIDMRTEIRRERTIELYLEGFRLDDLKRWKTAEVEMPMDITGIVRQGTEFETVYSTCPYNINADGRIIIETGRKWAEKNYLFPLPIDQFQLNPNLKQNPQW